MAFKISFKIGGCVRLNNSEVLPVTLAIYDQDGQVEELVSFLSPPPNSLENKFMEWQQAIGLQSNRPVIKKSEKSVSGLIDLTSLTDSLKNELNSWLSVDSWVNENGAADPRVSLVLERFGRRINKKNEVQIIVQTEDRQLRGLPWQEWDTLAGYTRGGVEVAISATNFQRLVHKQAPQLKSSVRILVVFGDEKLGFKEEESFIENLKQYGGEPEILKQPTRNEFELKLNDSQGWHIFCFAGHSESDPEKRIGRFQINPADGERGIIEIVELKDLLQKAIKKRLQLVIFNSCDGLGLANQLTDLSLPYCIVMREMVESNVAREILKHFLEAFVKDHSLFTSMNIARQQVQDKFAPGKSWLPVIVVNPLAQELTWNRLFSERRLSQRWEITLGLITIVLLFSLPMGICREFQGLSTLALYAQLYPHITVYPSLLLWIPLFTSYRLHCMIRVKTRPFIICTLVTILITVGALFFELHGDRMMLMEFKSDAVAIVDSKNLPQIFSIWKTPSAEITGIPKELFNTSRIFDQAGSLILKKSELESGIKKMSMVDNKKGFQGLLRIFTSYEVWRQNTGNFSLSRWFYIFNFTMIVACGLQLITLSATVAFVPNSIFNKNKYLTYLTIGEFGILLWVPFANYSIQNTKNLLFSSEFQGFLAGTNVLVFPGMFVLFLPTAISIFKSATKKYRPILSLLLLGSFGLTLLTSWFGITAIDQLFGMRSTAPLTPWFASITFFAPLFFLLVRWIDLRVGDD